MFKLIPRYLMATYLLPFVTSASFFVMFLLTFEVFKVLRLVITKGVPITLVLELLGHLALSFVPMAIPLSILFATIFTLGKLSGDSEFIAMRSLGLTREKLLAPFMVIAVVIATAVFSLNTEIIPYSNREFKKALTILTSKGLVSDIQKGSFFVEIPNVILFAEDVTDSGRMLKNLFINLKNPNGGEKTIFAKVGELVKEKSSEWGMGNIRLVLKDGSIINHGETKEGTEKILFDIYNFPLTEGAINIGFGEKDSMRPSSELWQIMKETEKKEKKTKRDIKTEIEFWGRLNTPLLCLVFTLLGFTLGVQKARGKSRGTGSTTLLILAGYYVLFFLGLSLSKDAIMPSYVAVFLPTVISFGMGVYFFRKMEWVS